MKKVALNLPVIDQDNLPNRPSIKSLDQVIKWIDEDYAYFFNRNVYEKQKKKLSVNRPFSLK
jgi:hypothetical protein